MTDDEAKAIGLRAVACKGWRWLPGCRVRRWGSLFTISEVMPGASWVEVLINGDIFDMGFEKAQRDIWPDFREPATLGCLLALVREAWGDPHAMPDAPGSEGCAGWGFRARGGWVADSCATEAEALVAAMEAA